MDNTGFGGLIPSGKGFVEDGVKLAQGHGLRPTRCIIGRRLVGWRDEAHRISARSREHRPSYRLPPMGSHLDPARPDARKRAGAYGVILIHLACLVNWSCRG